MTVPVVETERLVLRGWGPDDHAPMARANADATRWSRGYATEAATAALAHAFGLTEVIATIFPQNVRSVRVAVKLGMVLAEERGHPSGGRVAVYRIRP